MNSMNGYCIVILLLSCLMIIIKSSELPHWNDLSNSAIDSVHKYQTIEREKGNIINHLAIFLLGTLKQPWFGRITAARKTWGARSKHFYTVTGWDPENDVILKDSNYCKNLTSMNTINDINTKMIQLYSCDGINVLHFPYCDGRTVGVLLGSCCRCQGSMDYFNRVLHASHSSHNAPNWYIFSDDDYYMRLHMLDHIASSVHDSFNLSLSTPITLSPWNRRIDYGDDETFGFVLTVKNGHHYVLKPGYGSAHAGCLVPCVHRMLWKGWAGFNIAAIRLMSPSEGQDNLDDVCKRFLNVPHDVGLGIWSFMHSLTVIKVPLGFDDKWNTTTHFDPTLTIKNWNGVIFHKPNKLYNEFFDDFWIEAMHYSGQSSGQSNEFNIDTLISYETSLANTLLENSIPYKQNGIHNSLHYKRKRIRDELISQITNFTLKPIALTAYSPDNCKEDMILFKKWREDNNWPDSNENDPSKKVHHDSKMCLEYSQYIQNLIIDTKDITADLPTDDKLV